MQRTDDHIDLLHSPIDGTSLTGLARHPELWFDDGSVVLVAESMSFRVHRSILCKHSSVFSDTFGIPQPPDNGSETIEGCPVIRMHDSAHEFAQLLKACYDPFFFSFESAGTSIMSINSALSILRLSTKYHMPNFRSRSLYELNHHFPSESLAVFDDHFKAWRTIRKITNLDIIRAINIAREADALELLPCAFARLCNLGLDKAFVVDAPTFLDREDSQRLAIGREKLRIAAEDQLFAFHLASQVSDGCSQPRVCSENITALAVGIRSLLRRHPFNLKGRASATPGPSVLCLACSTQDDTSNKEGREMVWNSLPEYFGLGSWQELQRSSVYQA